MERFTDEQRSLSDGMKSLIEFHRMLLAKGQEEWFSKITIDSLPDDVVRKMADFFDKAIPNFSPAVFFAEDGIFRFRTKGTLVRVNFGRYYSDFIELMNALREDRQRQPQRKYEKRDKSHDSDEEPDLAVEKITYETPVPPTREPIKLTLRFPPKSFNSKSKGKQNLKIVHRPSGNRDETEKEDSYWTLKQADLNPPPPYYETFQIGGGTYTQFLDALSTTDIPQDIYMHSPIASPKDGQESSFIGVVKYFLVKYCLAFGSFARLKPCKECGGLFVEKRKGQRDFCSGLCRKRHHDKLQPREKRLCRERQNAWINSKRKQGNPYHVYMDDCKECQGPYPSGSCPVLRSKNEETFEGLDKAVKKR
jgi:hypothetical protein